ncbi:MAG: histidine decarboxylase, pyruvoyl type [Streptosporangiaceae bacterium]
MTPGPKQLPHPADVIRRAVSPYPGHHVGYPLTGGYVAAPVVVTDVQAASADEELGAIYGFDACEVLGGIGLVNLFVISSFCGTDDGLVAGIDILAPQDAEQFRVGVVARHDGERIPVYTMDEVLEASAALLHSRAFRDGSFLPCAMKQARIAGPAVVGAVLAVGVPEDPRRARLFMEAPFSYRCRAQDLPGRQMTSSVFLRERLMRAAASVTRIGRQRGVLYREAWVGGIAVPVTDGHVGTSLAAVPYVQLARQVVPEDPADLLAMTYPQWHSRFCAGKDDAAPQAAGPPARAQHQPRARRLTRAASS